MRLVHRRHTLSRLAAAALVLALGTGCGAFSGGLQGVPLPGGADVGDNPYRVQVEFADVVDLVPQSLVKVNDVAVGSVREITVDAQSWHAMVTVEVNRSVELPANAQARVTTTSLLGEKFVELSAPKDASGQLSDGATIPLSRSGRATEVEEVLGALSLLLNGGGVAQIRTITSELNKALEGNEPQIRALLKDLDTLVSGLDSRKSEITRALDALNRLGATLAQHTAQITTALDGLAPGLRELSDQRTQLVGMLQALDRLSGVAVDVIKRSREDVVADLEALRPTLTQLAKAGSDLPNSLQLIATYPFTDGAAAQAFKGDYSNLYVKADLNLSTVLENLLRSGPQVGGLGLGSLPGLGPLLGPLLAPSGAAQEPFPALGPRPPAAAPPQPNAGPGGILGSLLGGG